MKAAQFSRFGGPAVLAIVDLPNPHPGPGHIRIVVLAAGINATQWKLRMGLLSFGAGLPQTTGRDVAGVVDEVGESVTDVAVGDRVFGISDNGADAAELALLTYRAAIPPSLGFIDAAALPIALDSASRSLHELSVGRGICLLINGAAGGIGSTAVQLAVARGARVIGSASTANHNYLRLLDATCFLVAGVCARCNDGRPLINAPPRSTAPPAQAHAEPQPLSRHAIGFGTSTSPRQQPG